MKRDCSLSIPSKSPHDLETQQVAVQVSLRVAQSEQQQTGGRQMRQKLIIILVGLPARGKTFLCNKLMCYLNWWVPFPRSTGSVLIPDCSGDSIVHSCPSLTLEQAGD